MTMPAAIQATYSDYRRVKGRKVLQLILEVPLEQAPAVHEAFGEPLSDGTTWVAVARLDPTAKAERKGGKLAQRAGIICNEGAFDKFLTEHYMRIENQTPADFVRDWCGVESRAELDHDEEAARKFTNLEASYRAWLTVAA